MGVAFKEIIRSNEIDLDFLKSKIMVLDAYNVLYQFLTTIRARDGALLTDSKGNVTSHLAGIFSRSTNLMKKGIKLAYVFDGEPPKLKQSVIEARKSIKIYAEKKFLEAKKKEDLDEMKKYASRTSRLTKEMVGEAKNLVSALGIPFIQAPSEGEAQAAHMVKNGKGFAVGSQDFDSLIHGATALVRNLSVGGKRKRANSVHYETVKPELIGLSENLNNLGIDQNQLIALAMIVGTDYNPGGIKGIGPKGALNAVKKYKNDFETLFNEVKWDNNFNVPWSQVYYTIKKMPVSDDYILQWDEIDNDELFKLLVDEHDFSEARVKGSIERLSSGEQKQKSLTEF
jgi:flap endonuclease-1